MCELIQQYEKFAKTCYLVKDAEIIKQFFENTKTTYTLEKKDGKNILTFDNMMKITINPIVIKQKEQQAFQDNTSIYMSIRFNFYNYLTIKPAKEIIGEQQLQELMLPIEATYQFDNELKRFKEHGSQEYSAQFGLVDKGNIDPQFRLQNQELILALQTGLEKYNQLIYDDIIMKQKGKLDKFQILYFKGPHVPIYKRDTDKQIRQKIDDKTYRTNTTDQTDNMKINLSFQCLNNIPDRQSQIPEPLKQEEIKEKMQVFVLKEATRIMTQHAQAFKWIEQLKSASEQKIDKFYSENHSQLNKDNREQIENLYNISQNNKIGNYQFTNQSYRGLPQQVKNLAESEIKNSEAVIQDICQEKKHQRQYQCQIKTKFIGNEDDTQTNIVNFIDLMNMFTVYYPKNKYTFIVQPQFKFGKRNPSFGIVDSDGDVIQQKMITMQMETRLSVKQILDEPEALGGGNIISYIPTDLIGLDQIEEQPYETD